MRTSFHIPHPMLQDFVQCIMVVDVEVKEDGSQNICPYPPTPQPSLFFYIGDKVRVRKHGQSDFIEQPRSVVVGLQSSRVTLDIRKYHKAVRVGFHPGGLYRLMGLPMHELIDGSLDAADVWGREMEEVNAQLHEAKDMDAIHAVIECFLLRRLIKLKEASSVDNVMRDLQRFNGMLPVEHMASLSCLSLRQFERVCRQRIGVSPKFFARLVRFSSAWRMKEKQQDLTWTEIAHACDYFDQMHLIRDFREFAGYAPGVIEEELVRTPVRLQADMRL